MSDAYALLTAEIAPDAAGRFLAFLLAQAASPPDRLIVVMNCPGGHVVHGMAIYNAMMAMPYPIATHNIGNVDSIANVIFLGAAERYASPTATFMFHGVGFNGSDAERLEEKNLLEKLDVVKKDHKRISDVLASRTSLTVRQGMSLFKEQRTRDANWARDRGIVTEIRDFTFPTGGNIFLFQ